LALVAAFTAFLLAYYQQAFGHLDYETIYFGRKQLWLMTLYVGIGVLVADLVRPFSAFSRQVGVVAVMMLFSPRRSTGEALSILALGTSPWVRPT
jgi:hypothetical protein